MFSFCYNVLPQSGICTKEIFDKLIHTDLVIQRCQEIKTLQNNCPTDATEEQLKDLKKQITMLKAGNAEKNTPSLPCACFNAYFTDNYRHSESAVPSGLVTIDLDHIDDPHTFYEGLKEKALQKGMALAFITPSTHGLKLVLPVPQNAKTLEEALEMLSEALGIESYVDKSCHDFTRLSFLVPESYILYRNDAELFAERKAPEGFCTEAELDRKQLQQEDKDDTPAEVPENELDKHFIDGICFKDLLTAFCMDFCGAAEPPVTKRNDCLYYSTKIMRVYTGNDIEMAKRIMPKWGLDTQEWWATIKSAHKRPIAQSTRAEAEALLTRLRREKAIAEGATVWLLPEPPKILPPVFREYAHVCPPAFLPSALLSLLPTLGFYGTMAQANFSEPDEATEIRTPSFIVIVCAPPASQKGDITKIYKDLTKEQHELEEPLLEQLNKYNMNKQKEKKPDQPIRLMPERLSMTSLSVQLENAHGMHLLMFSPEMDSLKTSNGSGAWNDLSTVFRKSTDNDRLGQIFMSGESHSCNVPVYLNMLIEAQPETLHAFLNKKNIVNGMADRVIVAELPDTTGCRKMKIKKFSDFEWKNILDTIEYLKGIGQVVSEEEKDEEGNVINPAKIERQILNIPRSRKALQKWGIQHQDHYLQTQENQSEDHYMRRAKMLGFHAAMVAYMCSRCKETNAVVDFALWVAEYTLQSDMLQFGATWNEQYAKRQDERADRIIDIHKITKFNLFAALDDEFTAEDMVQKMQEQGKSLKNPYTKISKWIDAGFAVEIPQLGQTKKWRKIVNSDSAK